MPQIETLVADLNTHNILGIGRKPDSAQTNLDTTLSGTCRVKHKFVHIKAAISAPPSSRLSCDSARDSMDFNGAYIHFEDEWSTLGTLDVNRRMVASGNFSGCAYKVYRCDDGSWRCAHIARPSGSSPDALVALMDNYATQKGWTAVQSVTTAGLVNVNGCSEVFIVSQLINKRIDTIRLELSNQGLTLRRTAFSDPA